MCCYTMCYFRVGNEILRIKESPNHRYQPCSPASEQPQWEPHGSARSFELPPIGRDEGIDVDLVCRKNRGISMNVHLKG